VSYSGEGRRFVAGTAQGHRVRIGVVTALVALCACLVMVASASAFTAEGSIEQVYATGLAPNAQASLLKGRNVIYTQNADSEGGLLFRTVKPGGGYRVQLASNGEESGKLTVYKYNTKNAAPWDPEIYNQEITDSGYQYLTTRDGTKLAIDVHPPTEPAGEPGTGGLIKLPEFPTSVSHVPPYPTLIEYSGYGYANPAGPENGIAVLANLMGFAVVDVNMRGTGCSGGAYDFFEPLQNTDGYDVIETIAKQPWVLGHKVGMLGISYGAISQLFTAQLDPAALEAIAPMSTIDATATTLYPGGILNDGFAVAWSEQRQQNAEPAPGGQAWAQKRIEEGDTTCKANQALHGEANDLHKKIEENAEYHASVADALDPITFVDKINVPTYMACQFEDEQTGGHCLDLAEHFTGTTRKWFTFTNGAHVDSLDPYTYTRLYDFLELYVAHKAPIEESAVVKASAPIVYQEAMGLPKTDLITLPPDPIQEQPTYEKALEEFENLPEIRVLFDNGAGEAPLGGTTAAGNPYPAYEHTFSAFPIPGTIAQSWYFGPGGTLNEQKPTTEGVDKYTSNADATPLTDYSSNTGGGGLWSNAEKWEYNWVQNPAGTAVSYVTAPLATNTTAIGGGAVKLWVKSSAPDVDFQATVTEVRPDGNETFVQDGWLRASERKLATNAKNMFKQRPTVLQPIPTFLESDLEPMPANEFVPVTIPLYFEGHAYRKGSRIRVIIAAPNGTQPIWSFSHTEPEGGTASEEVAFSPSMPSSLTLPVVPGLSIPTALPACPSLRNEPCRPYEPFVNDGS
jgi:predicted acyl esterase